MTEKSEIDLLYEAAAFCGFKPADGWPAELNPRQLAALMAGGGFKEPHKQAYKTCGRMIADGIAAGTLAVVIIQPPSYKKHCIGRVKQADSWSGTPFSSALSSPVMEYGYTKTVTPDPIQHITREACRDWLRAISKPPSEYVRAWLGDALQVEAPKVDAGDTAPIERRTRAALIKEVQAEWPTIERDLQDASRNGLADSAKLVDGRGWNKGRALEWAKEHGKLTTREAATWFSPPAILPAKAKRGSK